MPQEFGSVAGAIGHSGVNLEDPRKKEDPDFNPPSLKSLRELKLQSPFPAPGQRQYTAPALLPGLETAAPMPDFSPQPGGDAIGAMPDPVMPGDRMPRPEYQEPERPGKWRTALGIGLSGMAGLGGPAQAARASDQFFLEPERRAERDYARELGEYSSSQGEWSTYFNEVMQRQELDMNRESLEELQTRPRSVPHRGSLTDREGNLLYKDEGGMFGAGGAAWEAEKMQAYRVWLEKPENAGKTLATMTATDRQEAERGRNRYFGGEVLTSLWDPDRPGTVTGEYRSESVGRAQPITVYGPTGIPSTGGEPGFQRTPPRAPRARGFSDSQRANFEIEYETERTEAAFFDEASREAVEKKFDAIFVRGAAHNEGDTLTRVTAVHYIRIARAELGDEALNSSVERLAEAWAKADGYTIPQVQ